MNGKDIGVSAVLSAFGNESSGVKNSQELFHSQPETESALQGGLDLPLAVETSTNPKNLVFKFSCQVVY